MTRRIFVFPILPALLLAASLTATRTIAQTEPTTMPAPIITPQPAPGTTPSAQEEMVPVIQYPNNPVTDILSFYERLTGKTLVRDANLAGPNLNIVSNQPMPKSQAIHFVEAALLLNGYAIVPDAEKRAKVININGGKNPRSEAPPLYANAASLPAGDQVVSFFMPLRFLSAQDAFAIFQGQIAQHQYASIVQVPNAQALVITENLPTIRQLVNLQELIDVPPARVVSEFVTLQRADAERVAEIITKLVDSKRADKTKAATNNAVPPPGGAPGAPGAAASANLFENDLVAGSVDLVPDTRTNRILVITRPTNFPYIKGLIEEFDKAVGTNAPLERPLKYATADEVLPVLADLLEENDSGKTGQQGANGQAQNNNNQSSSRRSRQNQNSQGNTQNNQNGANGSSSTIASQPDVLDSPEDLGPTSLIVGKTRLIADNKANSILVIGPPESQEKVRVILDKLDKRPAQVYLSTVIGQLKLTNDLDVGVDYAKLFQSGGAATTTTSSTGTTTTTGTTSTQSSGFAGTVVNNAVTSLLDPRTLTASSVFPATSGLALYGTINKSISVYVKALESTNRFKVLSRPVVYTANNKRAVISSGQRIPYAASTLSNLSSTSTTTSSTAAVSSTTEYNDVELKLEVIPLINSKNEVNLQIVQQNNTVAGSTIISGNSVPNIATQLINTTVTVPNGATVALGGLISESTTNDLSGIPVLMHLPWIGSAFRTTTKNRERNELIILIQPTVVQSNDDLADASAHEIERSRVGDDAYNFAAQPTPPPTPTPKPTATPTPAKKSNAGNVRPK
jgi:type II secretion system protein D